ncbi:hypothetical protein B5E41_00895 [Rhizobium esperanzae]|uniref:Uncharacterized protein n=1 Tax=Rhizobium esperanzae TaxID=1967781 RepID=A0A246E1J0_9HYPH|nr:hypothetical protein B5E41_00895 [Rhizobium esperanzae]
MVVCGYQFTPSLRFIQALRAISSKIGVGLRALGALWMMGITSKSAHGVDCGGLLARAYQKVNRRPNQPRVAEAVANLLRKEPSSNFLS